MGQKWAFLSKRLQKPAGGLRGSNMESMRINVTELTADPKTVSGEMESEAFELEEVEDIKAVLPLRYSLTLQVLGTEFLVQGKLEADVGMDCVRCGEFYSTTLVDSSFLRGYEIEENTDSIDLTPDIREAIVLCLPNFPICSESCKGLCAMCGTNLNKGACHCEAPPEENPWDALDGFDVRGKED
jgi:uncharacterized protein